MKILENNQMRKITMLNRISIDGYFAGPNGEIDWFIHDSEVDRAAHEGGQADTVLFGRVTYELFERYWPKAANDPNLPQEARNTGKELNEMTKIVFSGTLKEVSWENSMLIKGNVTEEVKKLKQGQGKNMIIFGSGTIVQQLSSAGLIDDYWFIITPVILGTGKTLFPGNKKIDLELLKTQHFESGNVLLHYKPKK